MSVVEDLGLREESPTAVVSRPTFQFLVDRVRECIDAGVLAPGDATEIAATIWAHVHGLASLRLSGHMKSVGDDEAFPAFFAKSLDGLIQGLAP